MASVDEKQGHGRVLEFDKVTKSFAKTDSNEITHALAEVNLTIQPGEFVSIVGTSGCGKSTLLSIIAGLENKTSGTTYINGKIGYMLQKDNLLEWRTVLNNVFLGLEIQRSNTPENKKYVIELLKKYGLYEFKDKYPNQLSGGMRQRVALIRTLAIKPKILLLDEATANIDSHTEKQIQASIENIRGSKTIVSIAHRLSTVEDANKIVYMEYGKIIEKGSFKELIELKGAFYNLWIRQKSGS